MSTTPWFKRRNIMFSEVMIIRFNAPEDAYGAMMTLEHPVGRSHRHERIHITS